MNAASSIASQLGYHPTTPELLHSALCSQGLPLALLLPPKIGSIEGERQRKIEYFLSVQLLASASPEVRRYPSVVAPLMADAEKFVDILNGRDDVIEVEVLSLDTDVEPVTIAAEAGVRLNLRVVMFECLY